jgi:hypothetical protein
MSTKLDNIGFRKALRLGRRKIRVFLENDKRPSRLWSNYDNSRGIPRPVQKLPKVGHFSVPKGEQ